MFLSTVKAKIFSDVESLRTFMINNATHTIDQLIKNAVRETHNKSVAKKSMKNKGNIKICIIKSWRTLEI